MLPTLDGERQRVVVLLLVDHVGQDEVSLVGLGRLLLARAGGRRLILQGLQVLRGKHIHVAGNLPLFERLEQQRPELLEIEGVAGLGGDLHDGLRGEDALPLDQPEFLGEEDADIAVDGEADAVVAAQTAQRE